MSATKKKKMKWTFVSWIITALMTIFAVIMTLRFIIIPKKWVLMFTGIMFIILVLLFVMSTKVKKKWKYGLSIFLNLIVAVAMVLVTVALPYVQSKMNNMFTTSNTENYVVNLYALTSEYKSNHSDIFGDTSSSENLMDYYNSMFITQTSSDQENTAYAVEQITNEFSGVPYLNECETVFDAVNALYNGDGDVLILSQAFAEALDDMEAFSGFLDNVKVISSYTRTVTVEIEPELEQENTSSAFSIYAAGSDTRTGILSLNDRFDVNMIVTINPDTHQVLIVSIPRDSYIPNMALGFGYDKLTHCGIYGIQNTMNSVNNWLETDINYYGIVNFMSFTKIVSAIDGVDVNNPYGFETDSGLYFPEGNIHINGDSALWYVRERHHLPDGDFGRNMHQMLVMKAVIEKMTSPAVLPNAINILNALSDSVLTNIDMNIIYSLVADTLNDGISWEIINYHILGGTGGAETASMPGQLLSCVFPYENDVEFVSQQIKAIYAGEVLVQQQLPSSY